MSRDLRRYARQTNFRLVLGFILLLFTVGLGLILLFYGVGGAITALLCILGGLVPVGIIWLVLAFMDWIVKHAGGD